MPTLGPNVTFACSNGGTVTMIDTAHHLTEFGLDDGWAVYDDLYVNPTVPTTLNISDSYDVEATVTHLTGDPVIRFRLISRQPNGTADIKLTGLKPNGWYRLQFDGVLAKTASGRAHDQASSDGVLTFTDVHLPDT